MFTTRDQIAYIYTRCDRLSNEMSKDRSCNEVYKNAIEGIRQDVEEIFNNM